MMKYLLISLFVVFMFEAEILAGECQDGWLGVDLGKKSYGVVVTKVVKNSPAWSAGFKKGDVLLRYNSIKITGFNQFVNLVRNTALCSYVTVIVRRSGKTLTLNAQLEAGIPKDQRILGQQSTNDNEII